MDAIGAADGVTPLVALLTSSVLAVQKNAARARRQRVHRQRRGRHPGNLAATHEVAGCATADTFPLYLCKDCRSEYFFDAKGYLRPSMAGFSEWPLHQRPTLALGGDGGDEPETGPVLAEAVAE